MEFIFFVGLIIIFVYFQNKISSLESLIKSKNTIEQPVQSVSESYTPQNVVTEEASMVSPQQTASANSTDTAVAKFVEWFSKDWILKVGALFVLLGFIWLVSYAFINGWIDEQGRILLGIIGGASILLFGHLLIKKVKEQGVVLELLGASVMIITIYSAQFFYHMFTTPVALFLILVVVFLVSFSSLVYNSVSLIVISVTLAFLSPLLVGETKTDYVSLFWFVLMICIGSIWVTFYKNWRFILSLCAFFVFMYSLSTFGFSDVFGRYVRFTPDEILMFRFFALSFVSLFFFSSISLVLFYKNTQKTDYISSAIVSALVIMYTFILVPRDLRSMFLMFASVLLIGAAYYVFKAQASINIIKSYSIASCILLLVATFVEFDGGTLLILLCLEAFAIPFILSKVFGEKNADYYILFSIPVLYQGMVNLISLWDRIDLRNYRSLYPSTPQVSPISLETVSLFLTVIYLLGVSFYFYKTINLNTAFLKVTKVYFAIFGFYTILFSWVFVELLFNNSSITSIVNLVLISIAGLSLYFSGVAKQSVYIKNYGIILLGVVILRLFGFEIWNLSVFYKIVVFFGVGFVFILSVLIPKKILFKK